jgi:hypothetical protein
MSFLPKPLKILSMTIVFGVVLFFIYLVGSFTVIALLVSSPDNLWPPLFQSWVYSCYLIPGVLAFLLARRWH